MPYRVIESYLKENSRKNVNYLAKFIEFFKIQVGMGLNAMEAERGNPPQSDTIADAFADVGIDSYYYY